MLISQVGPGKFVLSSNGCHLPVEAASPEKLLELIQAFQSEVETLPEVRAERANSMANARVEALAEELEDKPKALKGKRPSRQKRRWKPQQATGRRQPLKEMWANAHTSVEPGKLNPLVEPAIRRLSAAEWIRKNWDVVVRPPEGGSGFLFSYNSKERMDIARHYLGEEAA